MMKKGIIFFVVILMYNLTSSQTLVDSTKKWNTLLISQSGFEVGSELIKFGNDSILDGKIYKKVLRATSEPQSNRSSYGLIRETSEKKIFYRTDTSNQEYLLYAFNLNLNDTVISTALLSFNSGTSLYLQSIPLIVQSIDSILIGNNLRKQLHLDPVGFSMETDQWVEGMGSKSGVLHCDFGIAGGDLYHWWSVIR